uniref:F-box domain-containing protein n=1 Tax=Oryza glumipatula TaxID=40148 RepID=A0A0D9Y3C9_9ORYZ
MADNDIMAALPEDILLQVLSRVGNVKSLFRLAASCRRWLRRFTDRAFLRDLWGGHRAGDLLGFFFHRQRNSASTFGFLPAPPLRPLIPSSYDGEPLTARRGILLMRLSPSNDWSEATSHLLGLFNPITGEHHVLPHLKGPSNLGSFAVTSCAIIFSDDLAGKQPQPPSSGRFMFSQLFVTTKHKSIKTVYLHSYSATRSSWAAPAVFLDLRRFSLSSAVVHRGAAHWLCTDHVARATRDDYLYKLSVEVGGTATATATPRVSMTKLPVLDGGTPTPLLCVGGDGELTIVCVFIMHVRVWKQQRRGDVDGDGDDAAAWRRDVIWMPTEGIGGHDVQYPKSYMLEKAMDCLLPLRMDHSLDRPPVPYEMDLVEFFLLQLGGLCRGDLQDNQSIN